MPPTWSPFSAIAGLSLAGRQCPPAGYFDLVLAVRRFPPYLKGRSLQHTGVSKFYFRHFREVSRLNHYRNRLLTAPTDWPPMVRAAFRLRSPPTPYECACCMIMDPPGTLSYWRGAHQKDLPLDLRRRHWALWWGFLVGFPLPYLERQLGLDPIPTLSAQVRWMMTSSLRFAAWALSSDLTPAAVSPWEAKAILGIQTGTSFTAYGKTGPDGGTSRSAGWHLPTHAAQRVLRSPLVRSQLLSGVALHPIPRPVYRPGLVFGGPE